MSLRWLIWRTPQGSWHMLGSRVCTGRFEGRRQWLISPRLSRGRRLSFGWGPRPGSRP